MVRGLLCVALLFVTVTARADTWPDKDWAKGTPLAGPAVEALDAYAFPPRDDATRQGIRTDALLVIRDGQIIYERYAAPTTADTPHLTWSISKSLMATVLGVAYGDNRFKLTDPVARFYPPMKQHPTVTMADLLHWASGLDWQEDYEYAPLKSSVVAMLYTRGRADMAEFAADTEAVQCTGPGLPLFQRRQQYFVRRAQRHARSQGLYELPVGCAVQAAGHSQRHVGNRCRRNLRRLVLCLPDRARFGARRSADGAGRSLGRATIAAQRLGRFQPPALRQIQGRPGRSRPRRSLVAQPRGTPRPWPDAPADTFAALGHWGQALYVMPAEHLVIVRYGDDRDGSYRHNELLKRVLAAVQP